MKIRLDGTEIELGTEVVANPSETASETLEKIQIGSDVYSTPQGHTIIDSDGTAMAQEDGLQFASGCVEDDETNGKTVYIEMIRISQANYDTLKANGQLKTGAKYFIYDAQPVAVNASNLPYSSTQSTKQKIDEIVEEESYSITQPFTPPYSSNYTLKRYGKIVSFLIEGLWFTSMTADTDKHIATIPTALLPTNNITWATPLIDGNGNVKGYARTVINKRNGELIVKSSSTLSGNLGIQGNLMWLV